MQQEIVFLQPAKLVEPILPVLQKGKKGLITKEFFEFNLNNAHFYTTIIQSDIIRTVKFKNSDYYPFYALGFSPDPYIEHANLLTGSFETTAYEENYGGAAWKKNKVYTKFLKACLDKGYYNLLLFLKHSSCLALNNYKGIHDWFMQTFRGYLNAPYESSLRYNYRVITGPLSHLFDTTRMINDWVVYHTRKTVKDTTRITYLGNMYFLAEVSEEHLRDLPTANIKPLFCLVARKEYLPLLRAYFITNIPIPASMLELWVDNSLEEEGSKLKPLFRKYVKSRLVSSGVSIKYFDNLKVELLDEFKLPPFATLVAKKKWSEEVVNGWYDILEGKCRYAKPINVRLEDERIMGVLKLFEKEFEDVAASIS